MGHRIEQDSLGTLAVPAEALYGIHTARAMENFAIAGRRVHPRLWRAYGWVKLACAKVNHDLSLWQDTPERARAVFQACEELIRGDLDAWNLTDALQGGAGTSTNMNVNEVLANRALQLLGESPGRYDLVSPLDHINRHQSTNDTYPTALRVALLYGLREVEASLVRLQEAFQRKEQETAGVVKVGRTETRDAALITLGREMGAYAEAFARDRWRVFKCFERLRVVNLGGTAIGTGCGAPRTYIFRVTDTLRELTGLPLARAENLVEATQNADVFAETSGILRTCAVSLLKVATDLRLLSSGPDAGLHEIRLAPLQAGSSIMPAKVNPVIPETVSQAAMKIMGNDQVIAFAAASGSLELNPFMPLIADIMLESVELSRAACESFADRCVAMLEADARRCRELVNGATAVALALVPALGYERVAMLVKTAHERNVPLKKLVMEEGLLDDHTWESLTSAEAVTRLGFPDPMPEKGGVPPLY
ncbi:MAG TPA: aspartate ammonia-lyase [Candidatus Hydrogenedentes bacterium]|nr:aspartate ammonia-lyase [Candidatus Hydrogenedentota bacterium]